MKPVKSGRKPEPLSLGDDDLSNGPALLEVTECLVHLVEMEDAVDNRAGLRGSHRTVQGLKLRTIANE